MADIALLVCLRQASAEALTDRLRPLLSLSQAQRRVELLVVGHGPPDLCDMALRQVQLALGARCATLCHARPCAPDMALHAGLRMVSAPWVMLLPERHGAGEAQAVAALAELGVNSPDARPEELGAMPTQDCLVDHQHDLYLATAESWRRLPKRSGMRCWLSELFRRRGVRCRYVNRSGAPAAPFRLLQELVVGLLFKQSAE